MSLSCEDKLEWITKEDSTILAFLPLPDSDRATSSQSNEEMSDMAQPPGQAYAKESVLSNDLVQRGTLPPTHQIFVRIPEIWTEKGRKPAYTQTMPTPTSLDSLKEGLSLLLSIPTHSFRIQYGGKTLTNQVTLEIQGVTKGTTVWMIIGGLLGGADMDMRDSPSLACSAATPTHRPTQTHSQETQDSIDEWIDQLRISNPLTQDLATVIPAGPRGLPGIFRTIPGNKRHLLPRTPDRLGGFLELLQRTPSRDSPTCRP